ncbi:hypothetical protein B0H13DRAFT_1471718, partial [Mycena leptocephala]
PPHVEARPRHADPVFFDQSVALYCRYYHLPILIHSQIPWSVSPRLLCALPSLAICTSAARACANMVDVQRKRKGNVPVAVNLAVFMSAIVLLLNEWSGKRTGTVPDPEREMANVFQCMRVVRMCESR